jgi:hypothetical protein
MIYYKLAFLGSLGNFKNKNAKYSKVAETNGLQQWIQCT